ncbi:hypothetical protein WS67_17735 [Burkholderia singularis]|uniref:Uncharacterized protein n=1 Tax=Burkholderia singularis TaxID=1503053 RepID=A0A103DZR1_9BURK|nr:hypothetical protein WS67_17735 [Burkholderia singularis]
MRRPAARLLHLPALHGRTHTDSVAFALCRRIAMLGNCKPPRATVFTITRRRPPDLIHVSG